MPSSLSASFSKHTSLFILLGLLIVLPLFLLAIGQRQLLRPGAASSAETSVSLQPTADARVQSNFPDTNFGASPDHYIRTNHSLAIGGEITDSFIKFDLSTVHGTLTSATLNFTVRNIGPSPTPSLDGSLATTYVYTVPDSSWEELTVTYNKPPLMEKQVGTIPPPIAPGTSLSIPLDISLLSDFLGTNLSLGLSTCATCPNPGDGLNLNSRESTTPPQLLLTYLAPTPTPTALPASCFTPESNPFLIATNSTDTLTLNYSLLSGSGQFTASTSSLVTLASAGNTCVGSSCQQNFTVTSNSTTGSATITITKLVNNIPSCSGTVVITVVTPTPTPTSIPTPIPSVVLTSVTDTGSSLTFTYSQNYSTVSHLLLNSATAANLLHTSGTLFLNTNGLLTTVTYPYSVFDLIAGHPRAGDTVLLCHGNNYNICSQARTISSTITPTPTLPGPVLVSCVPATEDTYANSANPATNYGTALVLSAGESFTPSIASNYSYLKFNTTTFPSAGTYNQVKLRLTPDFNTSLFNNQTSIQVARITSSWTEAGLIYTNRPSINSSIYSSFAVENLFANPEIDVTTVTNSGSLTNGLSIQCIDAAQQFGSCSQGAQTLLNYASRETATKPQLCFYSVPTTITPTVTPTLAPTPTNIPPSACVPTNLSPTNGQVFTFPSYPWSIIATWNSPCPYMTAFKIQTGYVNNSNGPWDTTQIISGTGPYSMGAYVTDTYPLTKYWRVQACPDGNCDTATSSPFTTIHSFTVNIPATPTPTPTPFSGFGSLAFKVNFQGVGQDPVFPTHTVQVSLESSSYAYPPGFTTAVDVTYVPGTQGIFTGTLTNAQLNNQLAVGTYTLRIKGPSHLNRNLGPVILTSGNGSVDFTTNTNHDLRAGDITGIASTTPDNIVSLDDMTAFLAKWTSFQTPVTNNILLYDLNYDGILDVSDVALILSNWLSFNGTPGDN